MCLFTNAPFSSKQFLGMIGFNSKLGAWVEITDRAPALQCQAMNRAVAL